MNCGCCLMDRTEIVALDYGICPKCGADYRSDKQKREDAEAVAFARRDAAMVADFRRTHPGLLRDPNDRAAPRAQ